MIRLTYNQIAQHRENSINPVSIYSVDQGRTAQCFLKLANLTDDFVFVRVFHDENGSTYDASTAIVWDMPIANGQILEVDHIFMNNSAGNLAYRTDTANSINATLYGIIR